jgi:hypothetical protein
MILPYSADTYDTHLIVLALLRCDDLHVAIALLLAYEGVWAYYGEPIFFGCIRRLWELGWAGYDTIECDLAVLLCARR